VRRVHRLGRQRGARLERLADRVAAARLERLDEVQQRAEGSGAPQQRVAHLGRRRETVEHLRRRHAEQRVHERHDADHERELAGVAAAREGRFGEQLHQAAARRGELEQRALEALARAVAGVEQELQPALDLAPPEQRDRLAQRRDLAPRRHADRVRQPQQIEAQVRMALEEVLDGAAFRVREDEAEQLHQGDLGRQELAALDHHRAGEVVALEQLEAERHALLRLCAGVHLLGEQAHRPAAQLLGRLAQSHVVHAQQVDLGDRHAVEDRRVERGVARDVVERDGEAGRVQRVHALHHLRRHRHGLEQLEDDLLLRQELERVAEQQRLVDVDESLMRAERGRDAELAEHVAQHRRGRDRVVVHVRPIGAVVPEQQLVRNDALRAIEDRLAAEEEVRRWAFAHRLEPGARVHASPPPRRRAS
jgi:hypothetical protein